MESDEEMEWKRAEPMTGECCGERKCDKERERRKEEEEDLGVRRPVVKSLATTPYRHSLKFALFSCN